MVCRLPLKGVPFKPAPQQAGHNHEGQLLRFWGPAALSGTLRENDSRCLLFKARYLFFGGL